MQNSAFTSTLTSHSLTVLTLSSSQSAEKDARICCCVDQSVTIFCLLFLPSSLSDRKCTPWPCFRSLSWPSWERSTPTTSLRSRPPSSPTGGLYRRSLLIFIRTAVLFLLTASTCHVSGGLGSWESDDDADMDDEDSVVTALGCLGPLGGLLAPELQRYQKHLKGRRILFFGRPKSSVFCPPFDSNHKASLICFLQTNPLLPPASAADERKKNTNSFGGI